jgi:hypothetical protein
MYRLEFDDRALSAIDWSNSYNYRCFDFFNNYVDAMGFKDKTYFNGKRKIWLTKTDWKYMRPFMRDLDFNGIPYNAVKLK